MSVLQSMEEARRQRMEEWQCSVDARLSAIETLGVSVRRILIATHYSMDLSALIEKFEAANLLGLAAELSNPYNADGWLLRIWAYQDVTTEDAPE